MMYSTSADVLSYVLTDYLVFFFFNDTATTEIYTLSLHDALPICQPNHQDKPATFRPRRARDGSGRRSSGERGPGARRNPLHRDRKSTRLNSSHANISYAVFCLKKKKQTNCNHNILHTFKRNVDTS